MPAYSSADASAVISKPGQKNLTGDMYAMMIEEFTGQVLVAMQVASVTDGNFDWITLVGTDTLSNAAMGRPKVAKLEPGISPDGNPVEVGSQLLQVRQPIICRVAIGVMDDVQDRLNIRGRQPGEMGKVISKITDQVILHQVVKSALKTTGASEVSDLQGGAQVILAAANDELDGTKFEKACRDLALLLEERENELGDGVLWMPPRQRHALLDSDKLINSQYSGTNGNFAMAQVMRVADFPVKSTVRLTQTPQTVLDTDTFSYLFGTDYEVTAEQARVVATYGKRDAIMIAQAIPMTTEIWWDQTNKTHVLDVYTAFAAGPNNPAEAGVILKYAP